MHFKHENDGYSQKLLFLGLPNDKRVFNEHFLDVGESLQNNQALPLFRPSLSLSHIMASCVPSHQHYVIPHRRVFLICSFSFTKYEIFSSMFLAETIWVVAWAELCMQQQKYQTNFCGMLNSFLGVRAIL